MTRVAGNYPPGLLVDVGGHRLHALVEGEGEPAVVLEAGTWDFSPTWALVQPKVSQFARAIAYDRGGLGWSDPSPQPRTTENMVSELRTMCAALGVESPIVLVAQSFGALVAKFYAQRHADEVGGLVLIDPAHEDQFLRFPDVVRRAMPAMKTMEVEMLSTLRKTVASGAISALPIPPGLPETAADAYRAAVSSRPAAIDGMIAESEALEEIQEQLRSECIRTLGDLPLIVLSHGEPAPLPPMAANGPEVAAEYEVSWQAMQAEVAALSSTGRRIVAEGSGHMIHHDRPDLVVEAIRDVVGAVRSRSELGARLNRREQRDR